MNFKIYLTGILILLSTQFLFSQNEFKPSYIVNNENDTIFGTGNMSKNQEYCIFKRFNSEDYKKYNPNEIRSFRIIDGKYYVSKEIKEQDGKFKWYFLEFLIDGKIDLFVIPESGKYFIKKENEDILELDDVSKIENIDGNKYLVQDKKYIGYLKNYLSETPELYSEIDKIKRLNQRDLMNLSINYNKAVSSEYECVSYPGTKYLNDYKNKYKFELLSGVTYHNNYYSPQYGFLVHIWEPLINEKLYVKTGILYSDKPYFRKDSHNETERDYNLKIPLSFQYVFGKRSFKPTIALGWPTGILLVSSFQCGFICSLSDNVDFSLNGSVDGIFRLLYDRGAKDMFNNNFGHTINIGLVYNLK